MEKKCYQLGTYTAEDWQYIHEVLMRDGTLEDNIPPRSVDCTDDKLHSETRGTYLLSEDEVDELINHPKIKFINLDPSVYPEVLPPPQPGSSRYSSTVKNYRNPVGVCPNTNPTPAELNRAGYQLLRLTQKSDPWNGNSSTVINSNINYTYDGRHVDLVVGDDGVWIGHPEFINTGNGPTKFIGGNVLSRRNGQTALCGVLDLIFDSPYYIDPDFFNADSANRLMLRWDGTTVPTETAARNWWQKNNTTYRSSRFVSSSNGGTATGDNNFGIITINAAYTRSSAHGDNSNMPSSSNGGHGTPCASLAYGRTLGWAFNANKWQCNMFISGTTEAYFDILKIFHKIKPNNHIHGTKDPTLSSNSWLYVNLTPGSSGYYNFRGGGNTLYSSLPLFLSQNVQNNFGTCATHFASSSILTAAEECVVLGGPIFFVCAGNNNQKQVMPTHPDYNNYFANSDLPSATVNTQYVLNDSNQNHIINCNKTSNRRGFPAQAGYTSGEYPILSIGALDTEYKTGKERKVYYSNTGNAVDIFAPADKVIAAREVYNVNLPDYEKYGDTYTVNGITVNPYYDTYFNGTSSACPVTAGFIATLLQVNRTWTYQNVRNYFNNTIEAQSSSSMYSGTEATTVNDSNWTDDANLQGASLRILYNNFVAPTSYTFGTIPTSINEGSSGTFYVITTNVPDNTTLNWSINHTTTTSADFSTISGSFTVNDGIGSFNITINTDSLTEGSETFTVSIKKTDNTVVATSNSVTINDTSTSPPVEQSPPQTINFAYGAGLSFKGVIISIQ